MEISHGTRSLLAPVRRISPGGDGGQYFFGYYDLPAFGPGGHLCNRVDFRDRLPAPGDPCRLGTLDPETGEFRPFAETASWNFQQGAMLQWLPDGCVAFNDFDGQTDHGVVLDPRTGARRRLSRPVANVSPDGRWGLSINFARVWDFRPGYGYRNLADPLGEVAQPEEDGIFLVDMASGESRLLLHYPQMAALFAAGGGGEDRTESGAPKKLVVNHITFNAASDRFVYLLRTFPGPDGAWKTAVGTADLAGNQYPLMPWGFASHYHWRDEAVWLIYGDGGQGPGLYELTDRTDTARRLDPAFFTQDIHCSYSPDKQWILGDGYPNADGYRELYLYHLPTGRGMLLGEFFSPAVPVTDIRCDLHARWLPGGQGCTFDSTHEGFRAVYRMDLSQVLRRFV